MTRSHRHAQHQDGTLYTPPTPEPAAPPALRAQLEQLDELAPPQVDTVLAYAAKDGRLVSVNAARNVLADGWALFETFEVATGLVYEHKLDPNGQAWTL